MPHAQWDYILATSSVWGGRAWGEQEYGYDSRDWVGLFCWASSESVLEGFLEVGLLGTVLRRGEGGLTRSGEEWARSGMIGGMHDRM